MVTPLWRLTLSSLTQGRTAGRRASGKSANCWHQIPENERDHGLIDSQITIRNVRAVYCPNQVAIGEQIVLRLSDFLTNYLWQSGPLPRTISESALVLLRQWPAGTTWLHLVFSRWRGLRVGPEAIYVNKWHYFLGVFTRNQRNRDIFFLNSAVRKQPVKQIAISKWAVVAFCDYWFLCLEASQTTRANSVAKNIRNDWAEAGDECDAMKSICIKQHSESPRYKLNTTVVVHWESRDLLKIWRRKFGQEVTNG